MKKTADTCRPIHSILAERWSPRAFLPDAIDADMRTALKEAARWTPSCFGAEPWLFVFADRHDNPDAWHKLFAALVDGNKAWAQNAPLLVLVCARQNFDNGKTNRHCGYDTGAAAMALVLQAQAAGLCCHQMGGFDPAAAAAFAIDADVECMAVIAVGKQGDASSLPDPLREREVAPRQRKPLVDNFIDG